jgi:DNA-binding FadR family transcriptional regulator
MAIVAGEYAQGAILPGDTELLAKFRVSRTVLREAVKVLAGKGLLQSKARVGTRVRNRRDWNLFDADVLIWHAEAGFDSAFHIHVGEMRLAMEPEAAALASQRRTPAQLEEIFGWLGRMSEAGISNREFVDADLSFHLAVAEAAANPFMRSISTLIEVALVAALSRSSPLDDPKSLSHSIAAHRAIAEAILRHDADGAWTAMRVVIDEGISRATGRVFEHWRSL